ncbi:hypothetical protein QN277_006030 [Acacia crassicarpa]|uniref:Bifunctional inhibitor/plant lipid transfer protein/seed storage helical domain-containing protein n=1 Tax=Acacia crassicarpa TaxID=499986 RepID=A0AAE1IYC6_9FABA|nr:hypothetical protein QN277_006030 [Acacia crassicarpa]
MASKAHATSLLLTLNLLLFITLSSCAPTPCSPPPPSSQQAHCPIDVLKLDVCADLLNSVTVTIGSPRATPCCSLLRGLVDHDAAVCLCGAIRANVLDIIDVDISGSVEVILNKCGKSVSGFQCENN